MKPTPVQLRAACPQTEYSKDFLQGMINRMAVSFHKYGYVAEADTDNIKSLEQRIDKYLETRNTEYLMDVANFAMMEYMHPKIDGAFFQATDSDGSPGRTRLSGRVDDGRNR